MSGNALKFRLLEITRDHEAVLERFYRGIYLDAFAAQHEPLEIWKWALWSDEAPYTLTLRIACDGDAIAGGIAYEFYPRSACGLVTYMTVATATRGAGLGRRLLAEATAALRERGARAVFGEVNDPRIARTDESADQAWRRLERNQRWGARVVDLRYVQPALAGGLARDRGLLLVALDESRDTLPGPLVRAFVTELYAATERCLPDDLDPIAAQVALVQLDR